MDIKKVDELLRMKGNCDASIHTLTIEILNNIANGVAKLVETTEDIKQCLRVVNKKVETGENVKVLAKEEPIESKKPAPKKKATPKKVEPAKSVPVAEKILPTKDEVMKELVFYIKENSESALATIFTELGDYKNFPSIPQEKYEDLLTKIGVVDYPWAIT